MLSIKGVIIVVVGLVVLLRNLPGALLCLWPGLMRNREDEDDELPLAAAPVAEELARLDFTRLGARVEGPPMSRGQRRFDFALTREHTFASLFVDEVPLLTLTTPFSDGSFVLTSDHRRPGIERAGRYLAGGIPGATPEQLLTVHQRRVEGLKQLGKSPSAEPTLRGAVDARRRFFRGVGAREIRHLYAMRLVIALLALMFVISVLFGQPFGPAAGGVGASRIGGP